MSRHFLPLTILMAVALLFSACAPTPAATSAPTALPTAEPTPTENPQPSPTLPSPPADLFRPAENGLDMAAAPFNAPPVIDGDLSDWADFPCYTLDQASQIGYGDPAAWEGPSDLSGSFCWGWDEEALYLAAEVHDSALRIFSKGNFWENDYIELWVDANLPGDFDEAQNNGDDFQFGFLPGNFSDIPARATVFVPGVSTGKLRQIQVAFVPAEGGYRGEIKLPWATFGEWLERSNGRLGASLCFSDNDSDQPAQEMMLCSAPGAVMQWGNPILWNNLSLVGASPSPSPTETPASAAVSTDAPPATGSGPASMPAPLVSITFNHLTPADHQFVYLDTDNNPLTGSRSIYPGLGVDYLIQDDSLYYWTGLADPYTWAPNAWNWLSVVRVKNTASQSVWKFSSLAIRRPDISAAHPVKAAFSRQDAAWSGLYFSPVISMTYYDLVHTEPSPAPTPTPAPLYTFNFQNNFSAGDHLFLFLDTDSSPATGYAVGGIGADYMLQDGWLFQSAGGPGWGWNAVTCASLTFASGSNAHWSFGSNCIGAPAFGYAAVFQRQNSSWAAVYTSAPAAVTGYTVSHTEPAPPPTPPPAQTYTFTFQNNYNAGDRLRLYLNTDNNPATGDWIGGADYLAEWYPDGSFAGMYQWTAGWASISCPSLAATGTTSTQWSFEDSCIGTPSFPFTANYVRMNSGWSIVYNGGPDAVTGYSVSHTEP